MRKIDHDPNRGAEGVCCGLHFDTEITSINGVTVHFWIEDEAAQSKLPAAAKAIRGERDVVAITWSEGKPNGFWCPPEVIAV